MVRACHPAGELRIGEHVLAADGTSRAVTRIISRLGRPVTVHNFEVDVEHVYVVGQNGLLVHNSCTTNSIADSEGRLAKVYATVTVANGEIMKGTGVSTAARALTSGGDDAGHVIGKLLGGKGGATSGNIISQNRSVNRGAYRTFERSIATKLKELGNGSARIKVSILYDSKDAKRPAELLYSVIFSDGSTLARKFFN